MIIIIFLEYKKFSTKKNCQRLKFKSFFQLFKKKINKKNKNNNNNNNYFINLLKKAFQLNLQSQISKT